MNTIRALAAAVALTAALPAVAADREWDFFMYPQRDTVQTADAVSRGWDFFMYAHLDDVQTGSIPEPRDWDFFMYPQD